MTRYLRIRYDEPTNKQMEEMLTAILRVFGWEPSFFHPFMDDEGARHVEFETEMKGEEK